MILRLQVNTDGEWSTLNTRAVPEDKISVTVIELSTMQTAWMANYERFKDAQFRITQTEK